MQTDRALPLRTWSRRWLLRRGESAVASVGLALVVILAGVTAGCGYWLLHTQHLSQQESRRQQVETIGNLVAPAAERLLATGELTAVRQLLMNAADRHRLDRCRIVLPMGDVIAAEDARHLTAGLDDADWRGKLDPTPRFAVTDEVVVMHMPLIVPGRGSARLEVLAPIDPPEAVAWEAQAGMGMIGVASMLALLLVYRRFRDRMEAMGVIREALLARQRGEEATAALAVAGHLGAEAEAWNRLLAEQHELRRKTMVDEARASLGANPDAPATLAAGCDAVSHGLVLVDGDRRVRYANHAAAVFLKSSRDGLLGQRIDEVVPIREVVSLVREAVGGELRRRAVREREAQADGDDGVLRFSVHPVRQGDRHVAMLVIEDVTQQRVAEDARHRFVAQATHELRTPLTNIRLYLETLLEDGDAVAPETRSRCLNVINQETRRLERLVGDMLSMAEIEAGAMQVRRDDVKFDALLADVESDYQALAQEKQIRLQFKLPPKLPVVQGDRDRLMLAVQNLVGNALKYTPEGGQVTVTVEAGAGQLAIEVRDTGIGIAPADQARLFEKFYRAQDKRIAGITGSGLGLALSREIARLHGGDITVRSEIDQGSTFTLTLPAREESATATA